jgi:dTDP-4-amino-4,6-dideoxygalactose transaminase
MFIAPYISGKPSFKIKEILSQRKKQNRTFPLDREGCLFFFSARYALASAIEAFGLRSGNKILVQSYNCGTELDPLMHFKIEPVFYKINKDLSVDFEDLSTKATKELR